MKKTAASLFLLMIFLFTADPGRAKEKFSPQLEKEKAFQNAFTLISEADLYCSFFILEDVPDLRIGAGERGEEKTLLSDGDLFYIDKGAEAGLKEGQVWTILEIGPNVSLPGVKKRSGPLAFKRGRARLVRLDKNQGVARVEKVCGQVMAGYYLEAFEEKEGRLGKDLGYAVSTWKEDVLTGRIIYLDNEYVQIGPGQWALIDLGKENGIQVGRQLTIFRRTAEGKPLEAVGNAIVIDAGRTTSTVKVLSAKDVASIGDLVQVK